MNEEERELYVQEIADFRFGVIADLLNTHLARGELDDLVKQKAKMKHRIPHSNRTSISTGCIRKWLFLYRKYGKDGLAPKLRKDAGVSKAVPHHESALILSTLEKKPYLTAASAVKLLQQEGKISSPVTKSALSRLVIASGLSRSEQLKSRDDEQNLKFDFFYPLDCVQADDLHAFPVPDEKNNKRKAILMVGELVEPWRSLMMRHAGSYMPFSHSPNVPLHSKSESSISSKPTGESGNSTLTMARRSFQVKQNGF
jgi:transposase